MKKRSSFNQGDGKLFKYNESTIRVINRLLKDQKDMCQSNRIKGESPKRCAKLKPIKLPDIVSLFINESLEKSVREDKKARRQARSKP